RTRSHSLPGARPRPYGRTPGGRHRAAIARRAGLDIALTKASRSAPGRVGLDCRGPHERPLDLSLAHLASIRGKRSNFRLLSIDITPPLPVGPRSQPSSAVPFFSGSTARRSRSGCSASAVSEHVADRGRGHGGFEPGLEPGDKVRAAPCDEPW